LDNNIAIPSKTWQDFLFNKTNAVFADKLYICFMLDLNKIKNIFIRS